MTDPARPAPRASTWAQTLDAPLIFAIVGATTIAGIFWFPLWFVTAEVLRLWAPRGGMRWLASRGVPEYTDDSIATAIGIVPIVVIAIRVVIALNWLAPFLIFIRRSVPVSEGEWAAMLALVLGVAMATALAGVLRTTGWPRLFAIAGFAAVTTLAVAAQQSLWWRSNALVALPLVILAYLISTAAILTDRRLYRRAARRLGQPESRDSGRWERP